MELHSLDIGLRGNYALVARYVRPAAAPVCCEEYLKRELLWHGCITHVIYPFKKKKILTPSLHTSEHFYVIDDAAFPSEFGSSLQLVLLLDALFGLLTSITPSVQFVFSDMYIFI